MFRNRLFAFLGGVVFLLISLAGLYRLLWGFDLSIGRHQVSQMWSFFVFAFFAALTIVAFQQALRNRDTGV